MLAEHKKNSDFVREEDTKYLDLALIMDCTGSMQSWIDDCKKCLVDTIDMIVGTRPDMKVRVAFVGYRDFKDKE